MGDPPADLQVRLVAMVRSSPILMRALRAARAVDPPDWLIGAGAIRNLVWDRLHDRDHPTPLKDVDLVFFDPASLEPEREEAVRKALALRASDVPWDVKNQAAVHLWYPEVFGITVEPLKSAADGVATWPETATSVAVRLLADDSIEVIAPCGLDDLFGLVCRPNSRRITIEEYRRRVAANRIRQHWTDVQIVDTRT